VAGALLFVVGCASGGRGPAVVPVPTYFEHGQVPCEYESAGNVSVEVEFTTQREMNRNISRALGTAAAEQGADAVLQSTQQIKIPFRVEVSGPSSPGPSRGRIVDSMRGTKFRVRGTMIRFTQPCPEASFEGARADTLPDSVPLQDSTTRR